MNPGPHAPQTEPARPPGPPVRLGRTVRFAVRNAWDALGLVCMASLTIALATLIPLTLLIRLGLAPNPAVRLTGWCLILIMELLILPPLIAGACWLANVFIEHDEPAYADLWKGARRLYGRAVAMGAVQAVIKILLLSNLAFYLTRGTFLYLVLSVIFIYLLLFWMMQALYHYPLLVAAERGLLRREDQGRTPITTLLRNALILTLASPGYTFGLTALLAVLAALSLVSGAGIALIFGGFAAFLGMQATRDQLARFGHIEPPPDPDDPVPDERWRVR